MNDFFTAVRNRRSVRVLGRETPVARERILELVEQAALFSPTAFNGQEQRLVVLLNERHARFWDALKKKMEAVVPPEGLAETHKKLDGFRGGTGTILVYQDTSVVKGFQERFPLYSDNFPVWAQNASGMLEYVLWASLCEEGFGVSLQHYSALIEAETAADLGISADWKLVSQMPFGKPQESPSDGKTFEPLEKRVLVFE